MKPARMPSSRLVWARCDLNHAMRSHILVSTDPLPIHRRTGACSFNGYEPAIACDLASALLLQTYIGVDLSAITSAWLRQA